MQEITSTPSKEEGGGGFYYLADFAP